VLDTQGYKAHSDYVILLIFTATIVGRMRLNVTIYAHCMFCEFCVHSSQNVQSNCTHYAM